MNEKAEPTTKRAESSALRVRERYRSPHEEHDVRPFCSEDIHGWFGLTYAHYLVLPRSILQATPAEWQHKFTQLLNELREMTEHLDIADNYSVQLRDEGGKFMSDPWNDYRHGPIPELLSDGNASEEASK